MKLAINNHEGQISTFKDFNEIECREEIAHFITELELMKLELLELYDNYGMKKFDGVKE